MSCEIVIIAEGYSKDDGENQMRANCSCVLIRDEGVNVIVDTMTAWDSQFILKKLEEVNVAVEDINFVINTHGHSDHIGNNNLFLAAKHITGNSVSKGDVYEFDKVEDLKLSHNIKILRTPGHTSECISVKVSNTKWGTVIISGDLFEKEQDIKESNIWIYAGSHNEELQRKHRHLVSLEADYIIPGHGPMFQMTNEYKQILEKQNNL